MIYYSIAYIYGEVEEDIVIEGESSIQVQRGVGLFSNQTYVAFPGGIGIKFMVSSASVNTLFLSTFLDLDDN